MIKITLLISVIFLFVFISFSFAAGKITPFNWDTPVNPVDPVDLGELNKPKQQPEATNPTISGFRGDVQIFRSDGKLETFSASSNAELKDGDEIRTLDGSAIINFSDGSSMELGPNTSIKYSESELLIKIELLYGKLRARIVKPFLMLKKVLEITCGSYCTAAVRGTDFIMEYNPGTNTAKFYLYEGILDVGNPKGEIAQLNSGEAVTISSDGKMILEKLDREKWEQLVDEIKPAEIPKQIEQSGAAEKQTNTKSLNRWFGLAAALIIAAGAGVFIYRKFLRSAH